ncbi:NAD-dependent epimerase/dehydratase family protein [Streptomyces sp. SP18CS02]|uniref:NAD-dependent epimerase/dehydratase family protein n=1 Tax=Streptomyces sp. SP18CS02 TaxID=3002531 RepID=UPI002E79A11D|nr:NAD-dependent epimerase/dehydratase family protein [Streptomyces sp. SP18CS02]MEE1753358.1 NAD-dependent epimerase/dehydratase family protein [Streptomyces sp. SP18CS02]
MSARRVVVTGVTGFIGGRVAAALAARREGAGVELRAVGRGTPPAWWTEAGGTWTWADLSAPHSLRDVCRRADVLLHLAAKVAGDEESCAAVNVAGTAALMADAGRHGVGRIVHLSTAAVYGKGPHSGTTVETTETAPVSPASRTRLAGERFALDAGATVLRPGLVLGAGDRWVVPALAELVERVPGHWAGGDARLSMVGVEDLARLIATLALSSRPAPAGVHHASHPEPVRVGDLLDRLAALGVLPAVPGRRPAWEECLALLAATPGRVSERQFSLLAQDHWYRGDDIWHRSDCPPGPGVEAGLAASADWYRDHLASLR